MSVKRRRNRDIATALLAIACGGYALLMSVGVLPGHLTDGTPPWIGALAGLAFVIAGAMVFLRDHSRALDLLAAVLLASFSLVAAWIAWYDTGAISGGVPFLSAETNTSIGRVVIGFGAMICFVMFLYALRRFFGSHK